MVIWLKLEISEPRRGRLIHIAHMSGSPRSIIRLGFVWCQVPGEKSHKTRILGQCGFKTKAWWFFFCFVSRGLLNFWCYWHMNVFNLLISLYNTFWTCFIYSRLCRLWIGLVITKQKEGKLILIKQHFPVSSDNILIPVRGKHTLKIQGKSVT